LDVVRKDELDLGADVNARHDEDCVIMAKAAAGKAILILNYIELLKYVIF